MVLVVDNGSSRALYTLDLAADGEPELLIDPGTGIWFLAPAWSPDGSRIAYHQFGGGLQVVDAGGGANHRSLYQCSEASWSPDGEQILCDNAYGGSFVIVDASTGNRVHSISKVPGAKLPIWSPLGDKMAYAVDMNGPTSIWTSALDGSQDILVSGESSENYAPAWSPDGARIAYQSTQNSTLSEIWIADPDGRNKQRLTFTPGGSWSRAPAWSPDGNWLAFVSNQDASIGPERGEIYVLSLLTGDLFRVTNTGGAVYNWRVSWGQ
jgi:Tol biopolymer transport system component